ncbi:hypothetical protein GYMLUDRAFT_248456 [Collybiopsis luxurians FD-317 M1]|uniref:G domain-containing protein n=1 Tax=Collybiopsis luxurians FD-317 M1 TaxID=944289 RepID=A0A0D0BLJ0_9AGAR|nr:hypothetical protein GYMLUDRAFT_248456 [Collybiopsis luxurians FD-317 M1]
MPPRSERTLSVGSTFSTNTLSRAFDKFADVTQTVKEYCPRIRILVMGRRNAGKTTLLQRMAGSSDGQVFIRSSEGELIDPDTILRPSVERGRSHIEYEITYPSDEDYVFHDSRGMEAGSETEIKTLNEFIEDKQKKKILAQRLHVIWLCLPVDNDRPLGPQEMAFFNHGTEGVPVIAVFTKFEWRVTKAFGQLRDDGKSIAQARKEAPAKARQDFEVIQNERFINVSHKPAYYVYLKEMDQPSGSFDELTESTEGLVLNEVYQQLFLEIKHGDIKIAMAIALVQ